MVRRKKKKFVSNLERKIKGESNNNNKKPVSF